MVNPFSKISDLNEMRKQAQQIQQSLQQELIEVTHKGVRIVIDGAQKVKELEANGADNHTLLEAVNRSIEESQKVAAKKLAQMGGGLGGLLGGS